MKSTFLKAGAAVGAVAVAVLAAGPALAATTVSQATAHSLNLSIAGNSLITQTQTATNDGTHQTKTNPSTLPQVVGVIPGNNLASAGVFPQDAVANSNGTSFACSGLAGKGSTGVITTGTSSCNIDGKPVTISLGNLQLGSLVLDPASALGSALSTINNSVLTPLVTAIQTNIVNALNGAIAGTPLNIQLGGALSAIEGTCQANPTVATGKGYLVDTHGGSNDIPISATVAGQTLVVANLPANPPPNTHVLTNLNTVTQTIIDAVTTELNTALQGQLAPLGSALGSGSGVLGTLQTQVVNTLVQQLQPLLQPLQANVLDITLNKQIHSDANKKIDVTALDLQVLPAAAQFTGGHSLIAGQIGEVTCGPNAAQVIDHTPAPSPSPTGKVPTSIDSGLAGGSNTSTIIAAMSVLLAASGAAGTVAYRRYWMPRG